MSDCDSDSSRGSQSGGGEDEGPIIEVVYPVGEETEVPGTSGGLFKTVIRDGQATGEGELVRSAPPKGAKVTVHYTGTLAADNTKFDSSVDRDDPFVFTLGQGQVIKGWDKGVATMNIGEKCVLRCLPDFGYGAAGSPPKIPAAATLNFEVELLGWEKTEDISTKRDRSIVKDTLVEGEGYQHPDFESTVWIDVSAGPQPTDATGRYINDDKTAKRDGAAADSTFFKKENWKLVLGSDDLPAGLEHALRSMKRGERAFVTVSAGGLAGHKACVALPDDDPQKYVFGSELDASLEAAAGAPVRYDVLVRDFSLLKAWDFKGPERVTEGARRKDEGNAYFAAKRWRRAEEKYKKGIEFVESDYSLVEAADKAEAAKVKVTIHNNLAQVYINVRDTRAALENCNAALEVDPANLKALFRRAKVLGIFSEEWDLAIADLTKLLDLDANNEPAKAELEAVRARQRAYEQKMKSRYANMFAKIADKEE